MLLKMLFIIYVTYFLTGVVIGRPYFVIPSVVSETYTAPEESDMYQLNNKCAYTSNCITSSFASYSHCEKSS